MISAVTIVIAGIDVPYQIWEHARKLRMSRQEVKDELKETEGKPEIRARIRSQQQEIATRRMMEEIPKADVIVTNPIHYAVALRYDANTMGAPKVLAKGMHEIAMRIRRLGESNQVTLFEAPLLARALYHSTKVNGEVPAGLYLAVVQVLAYVFQLRQGNAQPPSPPTDLPIPDEFMRMVRR